MSDPPQQTSRQDSGDDLLLRLVPEHKLDRLEAENRLLRGEIAALERKLEQKDSQRQQVVDNYERILAKTERETDDEREPEGGLSGLLFDRLGSGPDRGP